MKEFVEPSTAGGAKPQVLADSGFLLFAGLLDTREAIHLFLHAVNMIQNAQSVFSCSGQQGQPG